MLVIAGIYLCYSIYCFFYFNSTSFKKIKDSIKNHIKNCNELNNHIEELKRSYVSIKSYDYGDSNMEDISNYNFKRNKWQEISKNNQVHNCSATVCKNASDQPFKYLCKYFDIKTNEDTLSNFESVLNDFAAAEQGRALLQKCKYYNVFKCTPSIQDIKNTLHIFAKISATLQKKAYLIFDTIEGRKYVGDNGARSFRLGMLKRVIDEGKQQVVIGGSGNGIDKLRPIKYR